LSRVDNVDSKKRKKKSISSTFLDLI